MFEELLYAHHIFTSCFMQPLIWWYKLNGLSKINWLCITIPDLPWTTLIIMSYANTAWHEQYFLRKKWCNNHLHLNLCTFEEQKELAIEPWYYSVVKPSLFRVYLISDDYLIRRGMVLLYSLFVCMYNVEKCNCNFEHFLLDLLLPLPIYKGNA